MANEIIKNLNQIDIDDGLELVEIKNKRGDKIGEFYFSPTDVGIVDRYNTAIQRFEEAILPMLNEDDNAEETDNPAAFVEKLNAVKEKLFDTMDYLFDSSVSKAFFSKVNPFTLVGGYFYCEKVLEAIGQFITQRLNVEVKHLNERTARYTHGYAARTSKHKDGKK